MSISLTSFAFSKGNYNFLGLQAFMLRASYRKAGNDTIVATASAGRLVATRTKPAVMRASQKSATG